MGGDCYPITIPGKMLSVVVMMSGIMLLALPITVLGSNFEKMVAMYEDDAKEVSSSAMTDDGMVSEFELREFLVTKKREGVLRKDVDIFASSRPRSPSRRWPTPRRRCKSSRRWSRKRPRRLRSF